ncbi:hypothetical protein KEM54_005646 [Ascosphaera aggregata]|nr:hypothetical protein KEM54_005646 [Ascosphaera aggregata]
MDSEELAEFQELSNKYQPDLPGPLIGEKVSTEVLSEQYVGGDSVYQEKFTCRCIKGDGNCGWRGDLDRLVAEKKRFRSMCEFLDQTGREPHLYELFLDAVEDVFAQVEQAIKDGRTKDDSTVEEPFNHEYTSDSIVTHFRLLTGSWLLLHQEDYAAFLSTPLEEYVNHTIDTVKTEIDEIGLQALLDGVIKGSGLGLEIIYVDRSEGPAPTKHRNLEPKEGEPVITLLYRPGHYDILYVNDGEVKSQN